MEILSYYSCLDFYRHLFSDTLVLCQQMSFLRIRSGKSSRACRETSRTKLHAPDTEPPQAVETDKSDARPRSYKLSDVCDLNNCHTREYKYAGNLYILTGFGVAGSLFYCLPIGDLDFHKSNSSQSGPSVYLREKKETENCRK